MSVTEQDRERAQDGISQYAEIPWDLFEDPEWAAVDAIAAALADERDRARAELHAKIVETTGTHDCPVCNAGRPLRDGATCPLCEGWTTL